MLALLEVNGVELERHLHLVKYYSNTFCVGGEDMAVEFENHVNVNDRRLQLKKGLILLTHLYSIIAASQMIRRQNTSPTWEGRFLSTG